MWKRSILHVNYSILLAPWDLGVFAYYGRIIRLYVIMEKSPQSMLHSKELGGDTLGLKELLYPTLQSEENGVC